MTLHLQFGVKQLDMQKKSLHVIILSDGLQGNAHLLYLGPVMISYRSRGFNNNVLTPIKKLNIQNNYTVDSK